MLDGDLVRQALDGRPASYGELARRWAPRVAAYCHARTARHDAVEDLTQEVLLRGLRGLPRLQDPGRFGSWLLGIAHRVCLDWVRARGRREISLDAGAGEGSLPAALALDDPPSAPLERDEARAELLRSVESLDEPYREVVMIYYYNRVTYAEMAEMLGVSAATVNARLTKARSMLRRRMSHLEHSQPVERVIRAASGPDPPARRRRI